ncbi:MAG: DUF4919 domain-containing protein [Bacteroidaceae bacterium]|nr:DUF4919 domain-containing protein [Bacteroidaceae bacterium]
MKKYLLTLATIFTTAFTLSAQQKLDLKLIKETVETESGYYNDILNIYQTDDPLIRLDDLALVYYGQAFTAEYRGANDKNEEELKNHIATGDHHKAYQTAKKILVYNPVSLNALFYAWRSSEALGKPQSEVNSYVNKYLSLLNMITSYGDGKSSRSPFYVISPDDQEHVLYGMLEITNIIERRLDTSTLCNIIRVEPSGKFSNSNVYMNVSLFLSHTSN